MSCTAALQDGWTALYCAAREDHTAVVEVLVADGADMNIGDKVSLIGVFSDCKSAVTVVHHSLDQHLVLRCSVAKLPLQIGTFRFQVTCTF